MEQEFTGIYKTYKKKNKSSWLQIYSFRTFEDVLKKIREREVNQAKEIDVARRATSKLMSEMSINEPVSMKSMMKSGIMDAMGSQLNSSVIASSIKAINKLDKNDLNVIICNGSHN
jgi:23S rRNA pseudoU1915 N3-methylase RlmH